MQPCARCDVSINRLLFGCVSADVELDAKGANLRLPLVSGLVKRNSNLAVKAMTVCVLHVLKLRNITKIRPSIVVSDAVSMIYLTFREVSKHIQKGEPMLSYANAIDHRVSVSVPWVNATHNRPHGKSSAAYASSENASSRIVVQQFAQSLRGKIGLSHDAVLSRIGQRLAGAINTARASLFSRKHQACAMGAT